MIGGWDTAIERNSLQTFHTLPSPSLKEKPLSLPSLQGGGSISANRGSDAVTNVDANEQGDHSLPAGRVRGGAAGPSWDYLQVGDFVTHKSFGKGVVKSIDGRFIIVAFTNKESRFLHPWVFEQGYMSVSSGED
ncbi:MAG: hypothetical protein IJ550_02680 [Bacteroidaceae bacterium]|nr:hypothetical protein [Bacteroidaceae bacterium]